MTCSATMAVLQSGVPYPSSCIVLHQPVPRLGCVGINLIHVRPARIGAGALDLHRLQYFIYRITLVKQWIRVAQQHMERSVLTLLFYEFFLTVKTELTMLCRAECAGDRLRRMLLHCCWLLGFVVCKSLIIFPTDEGLRIFSAGG